jgi:hypothetical protein
MALEHHWKMRHDLDVGIAQRRDVDRIHQELLGEASPEGDY